jgi:mgtE-like transporter
VQNSHGRRRRITHESGPAGTFAAFKENLRTYALDLGGLVGGFVVATYLGVFQLSPWAIAVYPAILGAKGVITGLLSGRLSTALHLGTVHPRFSKNTKSFHQLIEATIVLTLLMSVVMSLFSLVFGSLFWGVTLAESFDIVSVVVATMALGLTISLITTKVAFIAFKRGLDPDTVVNPIMTTVADISITLCYVLILNLYFLFSFGGKYMVTTVVLMQLFLTLYIIARNFREKDLRRNLKDSLFTILFVSVIVNITGTVLKNINAIAKERRVIYTVYPTLTDMAGDVSSLVGANATTKLALGLLRPSISSIRNHAKSILSAWAASVVMFLLLAILAPSMNGLFSASTFLNLISLLLIANVIAISAIILLSYGISILSFQKGLRLDTFVLPVESSLADSLMTIAILAALVLLR